MRPDKENNHPTTAMMICVMGSTDRVDFWLLPRHTLFISDFLPLSVEKGIFFLFHLYAIHLMTYNLVEKSKDKSLKLFLGKDVDKFIVGQSSCLFV